MNDQWTAKGGYAEGYKVPRLEQLTQGLSTLLVKDAHQF
jgi:outer membrane receptor for ferrienterochelin and colicins